MVFKFKMGKRPAKRDERNFKLISILNRKKLLILPDVFDCDENLEAKIPRPVFANNQWGDCVIATRAHQTLRFEYFEQKKILPISDDEVLNEYWTEQGGDSKSRPDEGLLILESLNTWRKKGWRIGMRDYDIYAFAEIDRFNPEEVKTGIYYLNGVFAGLNLPTSARCQFRWYMRWSVTKKNNEPGSLGGHAVYIVGWDKKGPICLTWGRKQKMTWDFWLKYADEAYCIVDNRDNFILNSPVDVEALDRKLETLK